MKRILQRFLALMMVLWSSSQLSAYDFHVDGIFYNILSQEDKTVEVCGPHGSIQYSGAITIPAEVTNESVTYTVVQIGPWSLGSDEITSVILPNTITTIGEQSFSGNKIESIVLPESLETIGKSAFNYCTELKEIELPAKVKTIGADAFGQTHSMSAINVVPENPYFCSVDGILYTFGPKALVAVPSGIEGDITIPEGVEEIGPKAFSSSHIASLHLPSTLKIIGAGAFAYCDFREITIPASVVEIGEGAFEDGFNWENIYVEEGSQSFSSIDGVLYNKEQTILLRCPTNKTEAEFPATLKEIAPHGFDRCHIKSVSLPEGVTKIGDWAFYQGYSDIEEVTLPSTLEDIGNGAFDMSYLKKMICKAVTPPQIENLSRDLTCPIFVPEESYDAYLASAWSAYNIVPGDGSQEVVADFEVDGIYYHVTSFAAKTVRVDRAPEGKEYSGVVEIPAEVQCNGTSYAVTEISREAFSRYENLTEVKIPDSVTTIGIFAFSYSGITSIEFPESVVSYDQGICYGCRNLTSAKLPENLDAVQTTLFADCASLSEIYIPLSVKEIWEGAFQGCASLEKIVLPEALRYIGGSAFENCSSLVEVNIPAGVYIIGADAFKGCTAVKAFNVDKENRYFTSYEGALFNKEGDILIIAPKGVEVVRVPETTTKIEDGAFEGSETITNVSLPETLTEIGNNAFADCSALQAIEVPSEVTTIGENAFNNCASLATVTLGASVESIGDNAFVGCDALTSMTVLAVVPPAYGQAQEPQNAPMMKAPSRAAANDGAFSDLVYQNCKLRVPEESVADYQATLPWSNFRNIEGIEMEKVSLDQTELEMEVGDEITLTATVTPESVEDKTVKWSSSNEDVVTVDGTTGKVTAVAAGTAEITAKTVNGAKATCTVTVTGNVIELTITFNYDCEIYEGYVGDTFQLSYTIEPEEIADEVLLNWYSTGPECVSVDENGLVTLIGVGLGGVYVSGEYNGKYFGGWIGIKVKEKPQIVPVSSLTLSAEEIELPLNYTYSLFGIIAPENATNTELEWSTSNPDVARVYQGVVYGIVPGEAVITAKTTDGSYLSASCKVKIVDPSGIEDTNGDAVKVSGKAGVITVKGAAVGATVEVYIMNGACVVVKTVESSVEELPVAASGIYVVRVGGKTFKVAL